MGRHSANERCGDEVGTFTLSHFHTFTTLGAGKDGREQEEK